MEFLDQEEEERKLNRGDATEVQRKKRYEVYKPIGVEGDVLTADTPEGFVDRWVLDHPPGRITKVLRAGYGFVIDDDVEVGDASVDGNRVPGGVVCKYGDPRHKTLQYLMRIDLDTYNKHQAEKQKVVDAIDDELYRKTSGELYTAKETKRESGIAVHKAKD